MNLSTVTDKQLFCEHAKHVHIAATATKWQTIARHTAIAENIDNERRVRARKGISK